MSDPDDLPIFRAPVRAEAAGGGSGPGARPSQRGRGGAARRGVRRPGQGLGLGRGGSCRRRRPKGALSEQRAKADAVAPRRALLDETYDSFASCSGGGHRGGHARLHAVLVPMPGRRAGQNDRTERGSSVPARAGRRRRRSAGRVSVRQRHVQLDPGVLDPLRPGLQFLLAEPGLCDGVLRGPARVCFLPGRGYRGDWPMAAPFVRPSQGPSACSAPTRAWVDGAKASQDASTTHRDRSGSTSRGLRTSRRRA